MSAGQNKNTQAPLSPQQKLEKTVKAADALIQEYKGVEEEITAEESYSKVTLQGLIIMANALPEKNEQATVDNINLNLQDALSKLKTAKAYAEGSWRERQALRMLFFLIATLVFVVGGWAIAGIVNSATIVAFLAPLLSFAPFITFPSFLVVTAALLLGLVIGLLSTTAFLSSDQAQGLRYRAKEESKPIRAYQGLGWLSVLLLSLLLIISLSFLPIVGWSIIAAPFICLIGLALFLISVDPLVTKCFKVSPADTRRFYIRLAIVLSIVLSIPIAILALPAMPIVFAGLIGLAGGLAGLVALMAFLSLLALNSAEERGAFFKQFFVAFLPSGLANPSKFEVIKGSSLLPRASTELFPHASEGELVSLLAYRFSKYESANHLKYFGKLMTYLDGVSSQLTIEMGSKPIEEGALFSQLKSALAAAALPNADLVTRLTQMMAIDQAAESYRASLNEAAQGQMRPLVEALVSYKTFLITEASKSEQTTLALIGAYSAEGAQDPNFSLLLAHLPPHALQEFGLAIMQWHKPERSASEAALQPPDSANSHEKVQALLSEIITHSEPDIGSELP